MAPSSITTTTAIHEETPTHITFHTSTGPATRKRAQTTPTFTSIPVISFRNINSSSLEERKALAVQVGKAFREVGFLYAKDHGIEDELQARVLGVMKEFFALSLEEKMKVGRQVFP